MGVRQVTQQFLSYRDAFKAINPKIEVQIGETGWPSMGISFNQTPNNNANLREYWRLIAAWAEQNHVMVQMFQAIDEPWKCDMASTNRSTFDGPNGAECHYGLWYRQGDEYHEKQ